MNYGELINYLETLRPAPFRMELEPLMEASLEMGNPHLNFPSVHVAGTNGKGSTAAFLHSILVANGLNAGLFTSPHLVDVCERIVFNKKCISENELLEIAEEILKHLSSPKQLSYFEFLTLAAFRYFEKRKVDIAVVETGLGGKLDATNIVKSVAVIITPISFDHKQHLGSTLADIAREKCGTIKRGVPTITAVQEESVMEVIRRCCDDAGSALIVAEPLRSDVPTGLLGEHQRQNAACAVEAAHVLKNLKYGIEDPIKGLKETKWPGRIDVLSTAPKVIADGAHNPAGAKALASYISQNVPRSNAVLVLGVFEDKDISAMCRPLMSVVREVICVRPSSERAASPKDTAAIARSFGANVHVENDVATALKQWLPKMGRDDTMFVTGSLSLVGEAMNYFKGKK